LCLSFQKSYFLEDLLALPSLCLEISIYTMRQILAQLVLFAPTILASPSSLSIRDSCSSGYTLCAPPGASTATTPQIGDVSFTSLFDDIVLSSLPASKSKRSLSSASLLTPRDASTASLCCVATLSCLTMHSLNIPFCYDPFTTNFFLPDASYGTVSTGAYTSPSGSKANLETGNYTLASGQTGNIYSSNPAEIPNTSTLPIPTPFTASGVGSAIPASALGGVTVTYTTTVSSTIQTAITIPPSTVLGSTIPETIIATSTLTTENNGGQQVVSTVSATEISTQTIQPTTVQGSTVEGTTVVAFLTTVTSVESANGESTSSSTSTATTTGKKNAAIKENSRGLFEVGTLWILGMLVWG